MPKSEVIKNLEEVAEDFTSLFAGFRDSYFAALSERRLPSREAIEYLQGDLEKSLETVKGLELGKHKDMIVRSYQTLQEAVNTYAEVEFRDLAKALGANGDMPDTNDPEKLKVYLVKRVEERVQNQFLRLVDAVIKYGNNYEGVASVGGSGALNKSFFYKEISASKLGNPLRKTLLGVISETDRYQVETIGAGNSMSKFVEATRKLIELGMPDKFFYNIPAEKESS